MIAPRKSKPFKTIAENMENVSTLFKILAYIEELGLQDSEKYWFVCVPSDISISVKKPLDNLATIKQEEFLTLHTENVATFDKSYIISVICASIYAYTVRDAILLTQEKEFSSLQKSEKELIETFKEICGDNSKESFKLKIVRCLDYIAKTLTPIIDY